jgi:hypothetical protein
MEEDERTCAVLCSAVVGRPAVTPVAPRPKHPAAIKTKHYALPPLIQYYTPGALYLRLRHCQQKDINYCMIHLCHSVLRNKDEHEPQDGASETKQLK